MIICGCCCCCCCCCCFFSPTLFAIWKYSEAFHQQQRFFEDLVISTRGNLLFYCFIRKHETFENNFFDHFSKIDFSPDSLFPFFLYDSGLRKIIYFVRSLSKCCYGQYGLLSTREALQDAA